MKNHHHLNLVKKYSRATRRVTLSHAEKMKMRGELLKGMEMAPALSAYVPVAVPRFLSRITSPYVRYLKNSKKVIVPLLLVFLVGGGTSYAAEQALPGDLLYPVKIHVNENVFSGLSFSALSQAQWAVNRVARRLHEAQAIGTTTAAQAGLTAEVINEAGTAHTKIAALDANDPADAGALTQQLAVLLQGQSTSTLPANAAATTSSAVYSNPLLVAPIVPHVSASVKITTTAASQGSARSTSAPTIPTPTVSSPVVSIPVISAPAVSVPPVTVHAVAAPSVTVSPVTIPAATAPVPKVTAPVPVTIPPVTNVIKGVTNGLSL